MTYFSDLQIRGFARGGGMMKAAPKAQVSGQHVGQAVTGGSIWSGFNGMIAGKRGFQKGNPGGPGRKKGSGVGRGTGTAVQKAAGAHRSAKSAYARHVKAGTHLSTEGHAALTNVVHREKLVHEAKQAAVADKSVEAGKASSLVDKASNPKAAGKVAAFDAKAHKAALTPAARTRVEKSVAADHSARVDRAHQHLQDLHAGAKAGAFKGEDIHGHIDTIAKGATHPILKDAAVKAGVDIKGTRTKADLVARLKEHATGQMKPGQAKHEALKPKAEAIPAKPATPKAEARPASEDKFGKSNAKVEPSNYGREEKAGLPHASADVADRVIGKPDAIREIPSMIGANHDASVRIANFGDRISARINHQDYHADRSITRDSKGKLVVENREFFVKPEAQGKGIGSETLGRQVEQARKMGVDRLETHAVRDTEGRSSIATNGYYTWARIGYDARIPPTVKAKLPPEFSHATRVSDLMQTPAGREAWKEHGKSIKMRFDLHPDSVSSKVHAAYMAERSAKTGAQPSQPNPTASKATLPTSPTTNSARPTPPGTPSPKVVPTPTISATKTSPKLPTSELKAVPAKPNHQAFRAGLEKLHRGEIDDRRNTVAEVAKHSGMAPHDVEATLRDLGAKGAVSFDHATPSDVAVAKGYYTFPLDHEGKPYHGFRVEREREI